MHSMSNAWRTGSDEPSIYDFKYPIDALTSKETCNWCWKWWSLADSNRWPSACKADALPTELKPLEQFLQSKICGKREAFVAIFAKQIRGNVLRQLEYACTWICLANVIAASCCFFALRKKQLVGRRRLELPTSPLSGARSNQLSYRPPYQHVYNLVAQALLTSY